MIIQPTNHRKTTKTTTETNRRIVDCNLCEEVRETCCSTSSRAENWKHGCPRRTSVCTSGKSRIHCQGLQGRRFKKCQFSIIAYKSNLIQWRKVHRSWKQLQISREKKWGASRAFEPMASALALICDQAVLLPFFLLVCPPNFAFPRKKKRKERLIAGYVGAAGLDSNEKVFDI